MQGTRTRLINAVRRSMIQRAELQRKIGTARDALKPGALVDRGKYRLSTAINDTAQAARDEFRANRLPITLAAIAGAVWLLREPIKEHAPRAAARLRDLIDGAVDTFRPADAGPTDDEILEDDDETAE